ncbi:hypothetical protein [Nonomuraea glycinis]|uniref:hypothetical protein n=1 Tax=Nonomuraea glycinis TaxID=2047744 RepID=UPI0033B1199A
MSETPEEQSEAAIGLGGESDVVAERSGATTETGRRPVPADPPEATDEADTEETADEENEEDKVPHPEAGPTA